MPRPEARVAVLTVLLPVAALMALPGCCEKTPRIEAPRNAVAADALSAADARVSIEGGEFFPRTVTIKVGDTVGWANTDRTNHNVGGSGLVSGIIAPGEAFMHTFDDAGTYQYICTFHPDTGGRVVVEPR